MVYMSMVMGHQSQSLSQNSNKNWIAGRVWPVMSVVSLTTLSMLTGQCRRITFTKVSKIIPFWRNISALSRERPSRASHRRNSPSKTSLIGLPRSPRCCISRVLPLTIGNDIGTGGDLGQTLKEPVMNAMFLYYFAFQQGGTTTILTYALTCLPFDYDLSSSLQKQQLVAFQSYHEV
jgi:hypothetical protein